MRRELLVFVPCLVSVAVGMTGCNDRSGKSNFGPGSTGATSSGTTPGGVIGTTGTMAPGMDMRSARSEHVATLMPNDANRRVLVTGGEVASFSIATTSEVFDPTTNMWTRVDDISPTVNDGFMLVGAQATARFRHTAIALGGTDARVVIAGGFGAERFDPQTGAALAFEALLTCFTFDPSTNTFVQVASMTGNRQLHNGALLPNGNVLVAGGIGNTAPAGSGLAGTSVLSAEVYDPIQNTWATVGSLGGAHTTGRMHTLANTTIIVSGSSLAVTLNGALTTNGGAVTSGQRVESYDTSALFTPGTPNAFDRANLGSDTMTSGPAFFAGGQDSGAAVVDTTEIYEPNGKTWSAGPVLSVARARVQVVEIGQTSDMVLAGGFDTNGIPSNIVDVYGVLSNTMLGTLTMSDPRSSHRSVTLEDGRVLICGGVDASGTRLMSTDIHTR